MQTKKIRPYRVITAFFLALVLTLGFVVDNTKVFAIPDVQYYGGNDILYFDPDAVDCASDGSGSASLRGNTVTEKIWSYLVDKGLSPEQAAGVMGNMDAESGYVVTRRQGSGDLLNSNFTNNAWGLAQWDGGRRYSSPSSGILGKLKSKHPELMKYTAVEYGGTDGNKKVPATDLDTILLFELDYLYQESTNRRVTASGFGKAANEWATLKLQKTVENATVFWHNNFEVSADSAAQVLSNRGGKAQAAFKSFSSNTGKTGSTSSGSTDGCSSSGGAVSGDLAKTALAYAWPDYHPAVYAHNKPEYQAAMKKAQSSGQYVGGGRSDSVSPGGGYQIGVDCGAFVTRLIIDSGVDPAYNRSGKGGVTDAQQAWANANWTGLGKGGKNGSKINIADLKPGDVAFEPGHTFAFVGKVPGLGKGDPAFKGIVSASFSTSGLSWRSPMAGHESATSSSVTWYRK
ncbi:MAG: hypothetical protein JWP06_1097 [Candidatus Saccharibacteria bacterium]|nr:hypothetical protein [Candidatus Saccharibacteria bacterium]